MLATYNQCGKFSEENYSKGLFVAWALVSNEIKFIATKTLASSFSYPDMDKVRSVSHETCWHIQTIVLLLLLDTNHFVPHNCLSSYGNNMHCPENTVGRHLSELQLTEHVG